MTKRNKVELGKRYRDTVSDFVGTATARYEYLNGCVRYSLTAKVTEPGKRPAEIVFDEEQLVEEDTGATPRPTTAHGGSRDAPPRTGM